MVWKITHLSLIHISLPWSTKGLDGARKWLDRVYRLYTESNKIVDTNDGSLDKVYHATVKKVTNDIETLNLNTAISQMMIFINECYKAETIYREYAEGFVKMLACFAPHLGEELWQYLGHEGDVYKRQVLKKRLKVKVLDLKH